MSERTISTDDLRELVLKVEGSLQVVQGAWTAIDSPASWRFIQVQNTREFCSQLSDGLQRSLAEARDEVKEAANHLITAHRRLHSALGYVVR